MSKNTPEEVMNKEEITLENPEVQTEASEEKETKKKSRFSKKKKTEKKPPKEESEEEKKERLEKEEKKKKAKPKDIKKASKRLIGYVTKYKGLLFLSALLIVSTTVVSVLASLTTYPIYDALEEVLVNTWQRLLTLA